MKQHRIAGWSRLLMGVCLANQVSACAPYLTKKDLHALNPAAEIIDVCVRAPTAHPHATAWAYHARSDKTVSEVDRAAFEEFAPMADTFYWYDPMAPSDSPERLPWPYHHMKCSTQSGRAPELPEKLPTIQLSYETREALIGILTQQCAPVPDEPQAQAAANKQFIGQVGTPIFVPARKTFTPEHVQEVSKTLKDALRGQVNDLMKYGVLGKGPTEAMVPLELRLRTPQTTVEPIDSPQGQFVGGFISEVPAAMGVPGGALIADAMIETGVVPQGTQEARLGKSLADMGVGAGQWFIGIDGTIIGGAATLTGAGAPIGVPVCIGSAALATNGAVTFCNGAKNFIIVLYNWKHGDGPPEMAPPTQSPTNTTPSQPSTQGAPPAPAPAAPAPAPKPAAPAPAPKPAPKPAKPAGKPSSTGQAATQVAKRCGRITFQSANTTTFTRCSGQQHHAISATIHRALENHQNLKGVYKYRDNRFVTQAFDKAAHNGYQKWHIELDNEVARWIDRSKKATPQDFEAYLRKLYAEEPLKSMFPNGF